MEFKKFKKWEESVCGLYFIRILHSSFRTTIKKLVANTFVVVLDLPLISFRSTSSYPMQKRGTTACKNVSVSTCHFTCHMKLYIFFTPRLIRPASGWSFSVPEWDQKKQKTTNVYCLPKGPTLPSFHVCILHTVFRGSGEGSIRETNRRVDSGNTK